MVHIENRIEKEIFSFEVKAGKDGKVFGSISSKQICERLNSLGYKVDKKMIVNKDGVSSLGLTYVDIELHKKVVAKVRVE